MLEYIGRYKVQERIGEGAMADVYRAHDPNIDRVLAIKVLKRELRENPEYVARFLREAKAAGALSHPAIVTVFDVGEVDGYPYIAMELLDGEPLDAVLAKTRLRAPEVVAIGRQLAEALDYAHEQGVVHRDIKPSNIMLGRDGLSVKILDFGIARLAEAGGDETEIQRTQLGQVMGTPRYMSPEQVLGQPIDGRSDLFSLGVVLYEMLTGQRAFDGANTGTLAIQIVQQDPRPIGKLAPETHAGLEFIIGKLLAKKPERRYATGGQLAEALRREEAALVASRVEVRSARFLPMPVRLTLAMAGTTAVALAVTVGVVLDRQSAAMEKMVLSSGAAVTNFVASNAALSAAENAGLPADQQDWAHVAAFVESAAEDPNVHGIVVTDSVGIVRAAKKTELVGMPYSRPKATGATTRLGQVAASPVAGAFRFERPIMYAGRDFGTVEVRLSRAELTAAASLSRWLMAGMAAAVLMVVALVSYLGARAVATPLGRLRNALDAAAESADGVRITHKRRDEFGQAFESFNRLSASFQQRLEAAVQTQGESPAKATASKRGKAAAPAAFAAPANESGDLDATTIAADRTVLASARG